MAGFAKGCDELVTFLFCTVSQKPQEEEPEAGNSAVAQRLIAANFMELLRRCKKFCTSNVIVLKLLNWMLKNKVRFDCTLSFK
ncbi:hypothetical protein lerEdw1_019058 [Lerista edwardsae]|nr:hypothetical protein lerEdw1_019058 [Lerista edwardsae]